MNASGPAVHRMMIGVLLLTVAGRIEAVEVSLDDVVAESRRGAVRYKLGGDASFDFDPDLNRLTSSGAWIAQSWVGPNQLTRYTHKVEDMVVDAEQGLEFRSYECVEGTLGAMMMANLCGNYRFGANMADDGGLVDDEVTGPPKSLDSYELSQLDWDGSTLILTLSRIDVASTEPYPEYSLTLTFSAVTAEDEPQASDESRDERP